MTTLGLVIRNLGRRPFRTFLTLVALATAIGAVMALTSVAGGLTESLRETYRAHGVDLVVTRAGAADRLSSSLDISYVSQIAKVDGIAAAAGVLLETLSLEEQQIFGVPSMGIDTSCWLFDDFHWLDRSEVSKNPSAKRIYLGENLAGRLDLPLGSEVAVFDEPLEISGFFSSSSVFESGSMILSLDKLQELTGRDDQITYINVRLDEAPSKTEMESMVMAIESIDPKLSASATDQFVESDVRMKLARSTAWMTSAIALIVGAIGILNTMMTSVLERTTEIGILRAIGWSHRRVAAMILLESIGMAVLATVFGGLGAAGLLALLSQAEATAGMLNPSLSVAVWIRGAMIGLGIGILGASLPAIRATRLRPTEALRHAG